MTQVQQPGSGALQTSSAGSSQPVSPGQSRATLCLVSALHAFTHLYTMVLVPLYLHLREDLHLTSDAQATLLVTVQNFTYCVGCLPLGILADKFSRKRLLTTGLLLNALALGALGFAHTYGWAMFCIALCGLAGSFYHPAATALVVALYPDRPGKALGGVGVGAAIGFFIGPLYAGWRSEVAGWRAPCLELAVAGLVMAVIFELFAREPHNAPHRLAKAEIHRTRNVWPFLIGVGIVALAFSFRDFGSSGMVTLTSLFLQRAHGFDAKETGLYLGLWCLVGALSNPLIGSLSDRRRFPALCIILVLTAVCAIAVPWWPRSWICAGLVLYGFFALATFPITEAALMETVPDALRGRTFGMFITVVGIIASVAHWAMGRAADSLGDQAHNVEAYVKWYGLVGVLIMMGMIGIPVLCWMRKRQLLLPTFRPASK